MLANLFGWDSNNVTLNLGFGATWAVDQQIAGFTLTHLKMDVDLA